jgi:hypothetical protein
LAVRKHCGCPENCVKTNGSPLTGPASAASVLREGEDEQPRAWPRRPGSFAQRAAELGARTREIPDPVRDHQVDAVFTHGKGVHCCERQADPTTKFFLGRPVVGRREHRRG